jgi:hypothetical protein
VELPALDPQLAEIADDLRAATARLHRLRDTLPAGQWPVRRDPARWSASECVEHLNLTSAAFVPLLERGLTDAAGRKATGRKYRRGFLGWALLKMTGPDAPGRMPTTPDFVPSTAAPAEVVIADFERWQAHLLALVAGADGLALDDVTLVSPFNARMRYNLYAALSILPRHQHRHLQQAERVWTPA